MPKKRTNRISKRRIYKKRRSYNKSYRKSNIKTKRRKTRKTRKTRSGQIRRINNKKLSGGEPIRCHEHADKIRKCFTGGKPGEISEICSGLIKGCGPLCKNGHILLAIEMQNFCDGGCNGGWGARLDVNKLGTSWRCGECDYDICETCYADFISNPDTMLP